MYDTAIEQSRERAILVGLSCTSNIAGIENADEYTMDELEALLETAGGDCVARVLQNKSSPDPRTLIGEGKVSEVKELLKIHEVDLVVFDNELSPSQTRNLEKDLEARVIDRSLLILDIFASRALTREGRLQVEAAQLQYILPRLSGLGLSLSRQGGGGQSAPIGTRGSGETQLESDRRHIHRRIDTLRDELKEVRRGRALIRDRHDKNEIPVVSLVGYTNAGKSTLFNALTDAGIPARNRLFDTLDTTVRPLNLDDVSEVLLTDTVGFIRKLPHHLVEAFRATLDELKYSKLLLHVVDASNPEWREQAAVVDELADSLGAESVPRLRVYNKADLLEADVSFADGLSVSSVTGAGLEALKSRVSELLGIGTHQVELLLPYARADLLDLLHREAKIQSEEYTEDGIAVTALCDARVFGRVAEWQT
ncbi:GTPase HflX [Clostridia bacterium]|nr:GTPase HflX [Clostridia bacterium]